MTRFQVVTDYLLKIPIYTTSCKFVKGTFINTQWQMKFYDFVCVCLFAFSKIFTHQNLKIERKKLKFHSTSDSEPCNYICEGKICEGKKIIFSKEKRFLVWKILEAKRKGLIFTQKDRPLQ